MKRKNLFFLSVLLIAAFVLPLSVLATTPTKEYHIPDYDAEEVVVNPETGETIYVQGEYDEGELVESYQHAPTDKLILKNIGIEFAEGNSNNLRTAGGKAPADNYARLYIDNENQEVVILLADSQKTGASEKIGVRVASAAQNKTIKLYENETFTIRYNTVKYSEKELDKVLDYVTDHMETLAVTYCGTDVINNTIIVGPTVKLEDEEAFKRGVLEALDLPLDHYSNIITIGEIVEYTLTAAQTSMGAPITTEDNYGGSAGFPWNRGFVTSGHIFMDNSQIDVYAGRRISSANTLGYMQTRRFNGSDDSAFVRLDTGCTFYTNYNVTSMVQSPSVGTR